MGRQAGLEVRGTERVVRAGRMARAGRGGVDKDLAVLGLARKYDPMVLVRKAIPDDWETLRDIRLAALKDAPEAFGSTHADQAKFTKEDWLRRIAGNSTFLAYLPQGTEPVGLSGGYQEEPGVAELVSMWVSPAARGYGVGQALIDAVADWAKTDTSARILHLWVTEANKSARRLYERCGFTPTGERQPLPSNPALEEIAMSRPL